MNTHEIHITFVGDDVEDFYGRIFWAACQEASDIDVVVTDIGMTPVVTGTHLTPT